MNTVNLKFRNTDININCDDQERIKFLAGRFNERVNAMSNSFQNTSDLKLFTIVGLMLEDQLDIVSKENELNSNEDKISEIKKVFDNTMLHIAEYIENLALKIEKS